MKNFQLTNTSSWKGNKPLKRVKGKDRAYFAENPSYNSKKSYQEY